MMTCRPNQHRSQQLPAEQFVGVRADQPDLEFLQSYYTALRGRLESRLLFGSQSRQ